MEQSADEQAKILLQSQKSFFLNLLTLFCKLDLLLLFLKWSSLQNNLSKLMPK
jgi:hypothetical protein